MKFRNDLTADQVRAAVSYDPDTGLFTRSFKNGSRVCGTKTDSGHILVWVCGALYKAHRLAWVIMTGEWPAQEIDHINLDPADNRWSNLRLATRAENTRNRTRFFRLHDLPRGVTITNRRFRAQAKIDGRQNHIGYFDTPDEAHAAYLAAIGPARAAFLPITAGAGGER